MQNTAEINGAGVFNDNSGVRFINCTFTQNHADFSGGSVFNRSSNPEFANCILWGNSPTEIADDDASSSSVSYSDVKSGWPGDGNIDSDPFRENAKKKDVHLKTGSSCIDAGNNAAAGEILNDFEGESRFFGVVDMGADRRRKRYHS